MQYVLYHPSRVNYTCCCCSRVLLSYRLHGLTLPNSNTEGVGALHACGASAAGVTNVSSAMSDVWVRCIRFFYLAGSRVHQSAQIRSLFTNLYGRTANSANHSLNLQCLLSACHLNNSPGHKHPEWRCGIPICSRNWQCCHQCD